MTTKQTLTDRIASAINGSPSSAEVDALLAEARAECESLTARKAKLKALALHPTTPAAEVKAARGKIADAEFDNERMEIAVESLETLLKRAQDREAAQAKAKAYQVAQAERDALAKELREIYPEAAGKIADLLARIVKNNRVVEEVNRALPENAEWLADVEHVVRGVASNGNLTSGQPGQTTRLIDKVSLPHLVGDEAARDPHGIWSKALHVGGFTGRPALRAVS